MTPESNLPPDALAGLLQQAGPRPAPADARLERARALARTVWQEEVRLLRRRRLVRLSAIALAAAAVLVLAVRRESPAPAAPPAVVATIASATGPVRVGDRRLRSGDTLRIGEDVRTDPSARAAIRLANGAELRLDADTDVRFAARAVVSLARGGVFVDTGAHAPRDRSVEVRTAIGTVHDIGTRFEVRLVDAGMRVRVRDGIVQLESGGATERADRGIQLLAGPDHRVVRDSAALSGADWDWVALAAEPFELDGKTVGAFVEWVSRESGRPVRFADAALARSASSIVIRGSAGRLTPEQALDTVLPTCGLTYRIDGGVVVIESAEGRGRRP